jgi:hypothetical protein
MTITASDFEKIVHAFYWVIKPAIVGKQFATDDLLAQALQMTIEVDPNTVTGTPFTPQITITGATATSTTDPNTITTHPWPHQHILSLNPTFVTLADDTLAGILNGNPILKFYGIQFSRDTVYDQAHPAASPFVSGAGPAFKYKFNFRSLVASSESFDEFANFVLSQLQTSTLPIQQNHLRSDFTVSFSGTTVPASFNIVEVRGFNERDESFTIVVSDDIASQNILTAAQLPANFGISFHFGNNETVTFSECKVFDIFRERFSKLPLLSWYEQHIFIRLTYKTKTVSINSNVVDIYTVKGKREKEISIELSNILGDNTVNKLTIENAVIESPNNELNINNGSNKNNRMELQFFDSTGNLVDELKKLSSPLVMFDIKVDKSKNDQVTSSRTFKKCKIVSINDNSSKKDDTKAHYPSNAPDDIKITVVFKYTRAT